MHAKITATSAAALEHEANTSLTQLIGALESARYPGTLSFCQDRSSRPQSPHETRDGSINDLVAQKFAGQFYNSLGYGRTLSEALEQAVLQARLDAGFASGQPRLHTAPGVDASGHPCVRAGFRRGEFVGVTIAAGTASLIR